MNGVPAILVPTSADTADEALFGAQITSLVLSDDDMAVVNSLAPGSLDSVLCVDLLSARWVVISRNIADTLVVSAPAPDALERLGVQPV